MRPSLTGWILLAMVCAPALAHAGQGRFLCASDQPYAYHVVAAVDAPVAPRFRQWLVTRSETGAPVGRAAVERADGFVVFATKSDDARMVEIHYGGELLAAFPGILGDADVHSGSDPKLLLLTWDQQSGPDHQVTARQQVVGPQGTVITSRQIDVVLGEDTPVFKLTADGAGIYKAAAAMHKLDVIAVLDSRTFRTLSSFDFNEYDFIGVSMQSPTSGFAIGEDGQLFRLGPGKISPMESGGVGFVAHDIEADARSRRVLVRGDGGYRVYDWNGRLLFAQDGFTTGGMAYVPEVPEVRLAIEGSIGVRNPAGKYIVRVNRGGNYSKTIPLPLSLAEWRRVSCFTPHSAAWIDADGQPRRVSFSRRR